MPKGDKLTAKQQAFVTAYVETGNASEAYRRAYSAEGMSADTIKKEASRLLDNPRLAPTIARHQAELEEQTRKAAESHGVTRERQIQEYASIAYFDIGDLAEWGENGEVVFRKSTQLTPRQRAAISSVALEVSPKGSKSVKLTLSPKQAALDSLSKILGLFDKDKREGAGDDAKLNLQINIG